MGTSMESLQYAYSGFARGSYVMLDNLKLGKPKKLAQYKLLKLLGTLSETISSQAYKFYRKVQRLFRKEVHSSEWKQGAY